MAWLPFSVLPGQSGSCVVCTVRLAAAACCLPASAMFVAVLARVGGQAAEIHVSFVHEDRLFPDVRLRSLFYSSV